MQHVAPLAPILLVAALIGSFGAPVAAASGPGNAPVVSAATRTAATGDATKARDAIDPTGRWIVLLRNDASVEAAGTRAHRIGSPSRRSA